MNGFIPTYAIFVVDSGKIHRLPNANQLRVPTDEDVRTGAKHMGLMAVTDWTYVQIDNGRE